MSSSVIGALYGFFSGFGLPAYPEDSVPPEAAPPYITVRLMAPDWRETAPFYARVWYRGASYAPLLSKVDEIERAIGEGASLPTEGGAVYIFREARFCQLMPFAGDSTLKCAYLSMRLLAHTH